MLTVKLITVQARASPTPEGTEVLPLTLCPMMERESLVVAPPTQKTGTTENMGPTTHKALTGQRDQTLVTTATKGKTIQRIQ